MSPVVPLVAVWKHLMSCFPGSFINHNGEFIAHRKSNTWFDLFSCPTELDIQCKVIEYLSRAAHKTLLYRRHSCNKHFWNGMRCGINRFLGTSFTHEDMDVIYTHLGNGVNHQKTIQFVESGYDMNLLNDQEDKNID